MKKIFIIAMLLISSVSIAQQYKYHKGQTIVVDDALTIYNETQTDSGAYFIDIKSKGWAPSEDNKYRELWSGKYDKTNDSCITVKSGVNQMIIDIFKTVFTYEELRRFMIDPHMSKGTDIGFVYFVDKYSNPYKMRMHFSLRNSLNDLDTVQVGKLYKLMYEKIRFNVKDGGLDSYVIDFRVNLKQVVDGTLNFDKLLKPRLPVTFEEMRLENERLKQEQLKKRAQ